ncbi:MAG: sigma-54-dependent Fis family transcriptional regulator, partial [Cyclobacteriaceae bacterium]|nr:sigma-54-dependent Fis family transcriptional regulator [Cyclobacteriaceae bacterium]
ELQHAIERAVILSSKNVLQPEDFTIQLPSKEGGTINIEKLNIEDVEKILIRKALEKHNGNVTRAATELGLTRPSFYRRLEKYGI